jgi:hypothetical protein
MPAGPPTGPTRRNSGSGGAPDVDPVAPAGARSTAESIVTNIAVSGHKRIAADGSSDTPGHPAVANQRQLPLRACARAFAIDAFANWVLPERTNVFGDDRMAGVGPAAGRVGSAPRVSRLASCATRTGLSLAPCFRMRACVGWFVSSVGGGARRFESSGERPREGVPARGLAARADCLPLGRAVRRRGDRVELRKQAA